jgi:hypothetical protein
MLTSDEKVIISLAGLFNEFLADLSASLFLLCCNDLGFKLI